MTNRALSWFKIGAQYDAKFTGFKIYANPKIGKQRCWNKITVFVYGDRRDAIEEVKRVAAQYGYTDVTVDHLARIK